ncbi:MAG: hypothetical protein PHH05_06510 [Syntrophaceticus sp.]|nr:hypothetical protein [Syntrophaceticus sp.]
MTTLILSLYQCLLALSNSHSYRSVIAIELTHTSPLEYESASIRDFMLHQLVHPVIKQLETAI